eukprot:scaffold5190_cov92-Skeletonema_dohrnii-CCMP3373.AAC.7
MPRNRHKQRNPNEEREDVEYSLRSRGQTHNMHVCSWTATSIAKRTSTAQRQPQPRRRGLTIPPIRSS